MKLMKKKRFSALMVVIIFIIATITANAAPLYGDINKDGAVNSLDSAAMSRHVLDIKKVTDTSMMDLSGDGIIDSRDYVLIKRYVLGIIESFPVEEMNPTPTPDPNDDEAWKNNTGTIQLGSRITVSGEGISVNGSVVNITAGGDHVVTGTLTNGMICINTQERVKLRLKGVNITNPNGPAIYFENVDKGFITISKDTVNYLTDGSSYSDEEATATLFSRDDLEIKGGGTLHIKGNYKHGINSNDDLTIEEGNIFIEATTDGIHTNEKVKIKGGNVNITAGSDGIDAGEAITIEDGTLNINAAGDGIKSAEDITITGGDFKLETDSDGIDSKMNLIIEDGNFDIKSDKDGLKAGGYINITGGTFDIAAASEGIQTDDYVEINGGNFKIKASSGIRAEKDIIINRGTLHVTQPREELESINGQIKVNGGQLNITVSGNEFIADKNNKILTGDIIFSEPSKTFSNQISVSLDTKINNAEIRYTTDGSVPTSRSTQYTSPLSFTKTTQLRAQAFVNGNPVGEMGTSIYVATQVNTRHDLPVLILDAYGKSKPGRNYIDAAFMLFEPGNNNEVSFTQQPAVATRAGFRLRGQSSANFEKAPYRIELWDNENNDAKYPLLGMPEDGDWILLSPYPDKSLMRNALAYELGRAKGLQAPRYRFVEVYTNFNNGVVTDTAYQGVYLLVERIEINSRRLDIAQLEKEHLSEPEISGGYLMQFNMGVAESPIIRGNGWSDLEVTEPDDLTSEQLAWITDYIQKTHNAIHTSNPSDPNTGYPAYIDVDSFVDYIIHNELARQGDSYMRSTRIYKDRGGKLVAGPLWDFDLGYDSFTGMGGFFGGGSSIEGFQFQSMMGGFGMGSPCDWFETLMYDPSFQQKVRTRWQELRRGPYSDQQLIALVDSLAAQLKTAPTRNFNKWRILGTSNVGGFGTQVTQTWEQQLDILKDFLIKRAAWLDNCGWAPTPNGGGGWDPWNPGGGGGWDPWNPGNGGGGWNPWNPGGGF
ncbi:MAG TPA: carbohydrate-binding domain-containing protein [Clostridium sp.]|nr:carbohydrate-binding domain-containing protein [Clostridium sp.]